MPESNTILYLLRNGHIGGSQRQTLYLARGLDAVGYRMCCVLCNDGVCAEQMRAYGPVHILGLSPWYSVHGILRRKQLLKKFAATVQQYNPSLVHCADVWLAPYAVTVAKMLNVPSVVHVRAPLAARNVGKFGCSNASKIISISLRTTQHLLDAGIERHAITQIYDSVDTGLFTHDGEHAALPPATMRVGIVGRVEPDKRQDVFLRLTSAVAAIRKDIVFLVVGEIRNQNYYAKLQTYIRDTGIGDQVCFLGERTDIADVLRGIDVLLSFSGGSIIYEAMSCGSVVISAGFSKQMYSLIKHGITGYLFPVIDIDKLAAHIVTLCDDRSLRQAIGSRASGWIQQHLSQSMMQRHTYDVYSTLISQSRK